LIGPVSSAPHRVPAPASDRDEELPDDRESVPAQSRGAEREERNAEVADPGEETV
jgi:hypothetical protein